jgi:hypothetical protein
MFSVLDSFRRILCFREKTRTKMLRTRPILEILEGRCLPSTIYQGAFSGFVQDNGADTADPDGTQPFIDNNYGGPGSVTVRPNPSGGFDINLAASINQSFVTPGESFSAGNQQARWHVNQLSGLSLTGKYLHAAEQSFRERGQEASNAAHSVNPSDACKSASNRHLLGPQTVERDGHRGASCGVQPGVRDAIAAVRFDKACEQFGWVAAV